MTGGGGLQHGRAEPAAGLQGQFHLVAVLAHRPAQALLRLADPVLDGVLEDEEEEDGGAGEGDEDDDEDDGYSE